MHGPDTPRRYISRQGRHVLIGLTPEETLEFESIDALAALDEAGTHEALAASKVLAATEAFPETVASVREHRWLELYRKHENAWTCWKALHREGHGSASHRTTEPGLRPASH